MIDVREEQPDDVAAIREVNRLAFGRGEEAYLVDVLRANGAVSLSLVAILAGELVGHVMYSPASVGPIVGAALGPMAVLPAYQRQGIGRALVETGTRELQQAACPFIIVVGHAGYYPRFGFTPARALGITCEWDVPDEVFMVLVLDPARMPRGQARYRPEFSTVSEP
jgi:putative acetyltransferase